MSITSIPRQMRYIKETYPSLWKKTSVIQVGAYLSNHLGLSGLTPQKGKDGAYELGLPVAGGVKFPYIDAKVDTGRFVRALIIEVPAGKNLVAYREMLGPGKFLSVWAKVHNVPHKYIEYPFDEVVKAGIDARETAETVAFIAEFGYEGGSKQ